MRYVLLLFLVVLFSSCATLQKQPSSSGNRPHWVHGMEKGYLITQADGATHEEAKNEAMLLVKDQIISSISSYVTSNATYATNEITKNELEHFIDNYQQVVDIHSEHFESLKGISASKAAGYFWETQRHNGERRIHYHVKYPFSSSELSGLVADYNRINNELDAQLSNLTYKKDDYDSVEAILSDLRQLNFLHPILPRHKKPLAAKRILHLRKLLEDIQIYRVTDVPNRLNYRLQLYGEPIKTLQTPDIYASCPLEVRKVRATEKGIIVNYSSHSCVESKDPYFTISYTFEQTTITRNINIYQIGEVPITR